MPVPQSHSFTITAQGGLLRVLQSACQICEGFDPNSGGAYPAVKPFTAIWDTGATNSVITQAVVDACGLLPISMTQVHGVSGASMAEVYMVNIHLPNGVLIPDVEVTKGVLTPGSDVLIGMDIITIGDFSVTNKGGITIFSFRVPSQEHVDFVKEHKEALLKGRFQHGGGKKDRKKAPKQFGKNKKKKPY